MKSYHRYLGITCAAAAGVLLAACGGGKKTYKDGTYTVQSAAHINEDESDEEGNGYGVVTLTIKGDAITECTYQTYTLDGTLKDTDYGKEGGEIANRDYYNKAQKAVAACGQYAAQLVEKQNPRDIDAISGATINYDEFLDASLAALDQASGK